MLPAPTLCRRGSRGIDGFGVRGPLDAKLSEITGGPRCEEPQRPLNLRVRVGRSANQLAQLLLAQARYQRADRGVRRTIRSLTGQVAEAVSSVRRTDLGAHVATAVLHCVPAEPGEQRGA